MDPQTARTLTDAYARRIIHPRIDFTTAEGHQYTVRLVPYLKPLLRPGLRALDLGSSFGKSALLMAELGAHATGVDGYYGALHFSTNLTRRLNATAVFCRGRLCTVALPRRKLRPGPVPTQHR